MRKIWKKGAALTLSVVLGISLLACGKNTDTDNQGSGENSTEAEYVYVPEYISLEKDENSWMNSPVLQGDRLYYTTYSYDEETGESSNRFCYREFSNPSEEKTMELAFTIEGYETGMNDYQFDAEGNLYAIWYVYPVWIEGEDYDYNDNTTYLTKYDSNMNQVFAQDLKDVFVDENNSYIQNMAIGGDGKVYASSNDLIYAFNSDGTFEKSIPTGADWINGLFSTGDGRVFFAYYGMQGIELKEIDTATGALSKAYSNFPDMSGSTGAKGGSDGKLLASGYSKLYEYDLATQETTVLLDWLDCNVDGNYVQDFCFLEDGRIAVYYDNYADAPELTILTKKAASEVTIKETITVATLYEGGSTLQKAAVNFNKTNDKYQIKIKTYIDSNAEWTETTYSDGVALMNADMVSNNAPDIIDLSSADITNLAKKGALEDLTPYLEASTVANKNDFVESVLNAYKIDGKQVTIPKGFTVATLMAKSAYVGTEPGWTMDDVIALAQEHPDAMLMHYVNKEYALQICMQYSSENFIDWVNGTCSFDSPEFIKVLEFANRFEQEVNYDYESSFPAMIQSGQVLLADTSFYDVQEYQMYNLMFEEDATCIGYPTFDGSAGVFLRGSEMYGISAKSEHKEGAWVFIETILAKDGYEDMWQFPSRTDALEAVFEEAMTPDYQYDENGEIMYDEEGNALQYPKTSWGYDDWDTEIYAASQEEIDSLKEMIAMAKPIGMSDQTIFTMISEEAAAYFEGQKSAEEVAKVIQSRVEIYVSENS